MIGGERRDPPVRLGSDEWDLRGRTMERACRFSSPTRLRDPVASRIGAARGSAWDAQVLLSKQCLRAVHRRDAAPVRDRLLGVPSLERHDKWLRRWRCSRRGAGIDAGLVERVLVHAACLSSQVPELKCSSKGSRSSRGRLGLTTEPYPAVPLALMFKRKSGSPTATSRLPTQRDICRSRESWWRGSRFVNAMAGINRMPNALGKPERASPGLDAREFRPAQIGPRGCVGPARASPREASITRGAFGMDTRAAAAILSASAFGPV